jgi:hypothetical protein
MRSITLLVLLLTFASVALPQMMPSTLPPGFINGAANPEQIPDSTARKLVLLSLRLPDSPDENAIARQEAHLRFIGLSGQDLAAAKTIINDFTAKYAGWATTAPRQATGADAIVNDTWTQLANRLSSSGLGTLLRFITTEKRHMVVKP